jgi:hypothetical protein
MLPLVTSENWLLPALLVVAENPIVLVEPENRGNRGKCLLYQKQRKIEEKGMTHVMIWSGVWNL